MTTIFQGLSRKTLGSHGSTATVNFQGLVRKVLGGPVPSAYFGGLTRKVLVEQITDFGPIPIFPNLPAGYPVKFSPSMDTTVGTTKSLREIRVNQRSVPVWDIEIPFEELLDQTQNQTPYSPFSGDTQYMQLVQNWLMMYGQTGVFALNCPWDNSRTSQAIGVGNGHDYIFTIYRTWGLDGEATVAPVGMVNAVTQVQGNSVTISPSLYRIKRNKIIFTDSRGVAYPPIIGLNITMTFSYYHLCRFVEDEQDFEEFAKNRWTVKSLKMRSVYWP